MKWTARALGADPGALVARLGEHGPVRATRIGAWHPVEWIGALREAGEPACLLESQAGPRWLARWSILGAYPRFVLEGDREGTTVRLAGREEHSDVHVLDLLDRLLALERAEAPRAESGEPLPFAGGAIGYLSYDARHWFERLPQRALVDVETPLAAFAYFDAAVVRDGWNDETYLVERPGSAGAERLRALIAAPARRVAGRVELSVRDLAWGFDPASYEKMVSAAKELIFAGDIFEVCVSQRLRVPFRGPGALVYESLRACSPAPFAAFLGFDDLEVISSSPERFLLAENGTVETRPIKGTTPRGMTPEEDVRLATALRLDRKQQAEHLMIVDLERSDLGRVCRVDGVSVPHLAVLESYSHVHHLVSTVRGELRPGVTLTALLAATFPGGSITGAPKIRSIEIIDLLEPVARGLYTGSIGYVSKSGRLDMSIVIRTLIRWRDALYGQVGGAVVADSDPAGEYRETLQKAQGMIEALERLAAR